MGRAVTAATAATAVTAVTAATAATAVLGASEAIPVGLHLTVTCTSFSGSAVCGRDEQSDGVPGCLSTERMRERRGMVEAALCGHLKSPSAFLPQKH